MKCERLDLPHFSTFMCGETSFVKVEEIVISSTCVSVV